ncbi:MAG: hypothetical protein SWO11_20320 [Thermodesulfobacteriota bacterium]|nr:hypothetical protein [Thermodesulfobacteriota bacterium]
MFNPQVRFQYSDRGIQDIFRKVGNGPFSTFKARGRLQGRHFEGRGTGTIDKGKRSYKLTVKLPVDAAYKQIDHFNIIVKTKEEQTSGRKRVTLEDYQISGNSMPLGHRSGSANDRFFYQLKGPLARKNITGFKTRITTHVDEQVAKGKWVLKKYWREAVEFKFNDNEGVFILLPGKAGSSLSMDQSTEKIYALEHHADERVAEPALSFELSMVDREKIDSGPQTFTLYFDATTVINSPFCGKDTRRSRG